MSQRLSSSSYVKLYDSEIVPLLLRRPAPATTSLYSTLQCTTSGGALGGGGDACKTVSIRQQHLERDFVRSSRALFHTAPSFLAKDNSSAGKEVTGEKTAEQSLAAKDDGNNKKFEPPGLEGTEKLGLFARFKKMYKEYWYVLLPVHCITSAGWLGGFYYVSVR